MIDYLTLTLTHIPAWMHARLDVLCHRIVKYCPATGRIDYETACWESLRSDDHQIAVRYNGQELRIMGSPGRVMGSGDAVFGMMPYCRDVRACALAMIDFVARCVGVDLPRELACWRCTRIDATCNYLMPSLADVRVALDYLRKCDGHRKKLNRDREDSVTWSERSTLKSAIAYAKGPQLRAMMARRDYSGYKYTDDDLALADRLLRLELRLRRHWFDRVLDRPWYEITWDVLAAEHERYFGAMIGAEIMVESDLQLLDAVIAAAPTEGQGKSAFRTLQLIRTLGPVIARESMARRTWYLHLRILRDAGLGDVDIASGTVVQLRRRRIVVGDAITSWDHLRSVA